MVDRGIIPKTWRFVAFKGLTIAQKNLTKTCGYKSREKEMLASESVMLVNIILNEVNDAVRHALDVNDDIKKFIYENIYETIGYVNKEEYCDAATSNLSAILALQENKIPA